jgi:hypothetical protein
MGTGCISLGHLLDIFARVEADIAGRRVALTLLSIRCRGDRVQIACKASPARSVHTRVTDPLDQGCLTATKDAT